MGLDRAGRHRRVPRGPEPGRRRACSTTSPRKGVARSCRWWTRKSARCCACSRPRSARARILEIGTAIGYSGIWLAGALPPDGMLMTMEMDEERGARSAREFRARRPRGSRQRHRRRRAAKIAKVAGPFDLIFQDGDKQLYMPLLDRLVALLRPGGLLVTDNVLWDGEVVPGFTAAERDGFSRARPIDETHACDRRVQRTRGRASSAADDHRSAARRRLDLGEARMTIDSWLQVGHRRRRAARPARAETAARSARAGDHRRCARPTSTTTRRHRAHRSHPDDRASRSSAAACARAR